MDTLPNEYVEERAWGVAAVFYYLIMMAAFGIGLYGLFNLIWLAGMAVEQNARIIAAI
jgi:hypothetical protein